MCIFLSSFPGGIVSALRAWGAGIIFLAVKGFVVDVKKLRKSGEGVGSWFFFSFLFFVLLER